MIEGDASFGYELICDRCEMPADETFETFIEAVSFKKDPDNNWISRKTEGVWEDVCQDCH